MHDYYDVCVIGAGVVGSAIARELATENFNEKFSIIVLDAKKCPGGETSLNNSGVLHSGLHEKRGSLKARLAHEGSRLARNFAEEHNVPIRHTGMLIAIPKGAILGGLWKEWRTLWRLWRNGQAQNIPIEFLAPYGIHTKEPNIRACAGIFMKDVWVVDSRAFVEALTKSAILRKVEFQFNQTVIAIKKCEREFVITTSHGIIRAKAIINAAGLYADDIANMALCEKRYQIYPWRGEYYEIVNPKKRNLVNGLVYPALPENSAGKGIHFSPRPNGRMFLGPNTVPLEQKNDYAMNKTPPDIFLAAARKFLPELEASDIEWSYSGIRPKLSRELHEEDFCISIDSKNPLLINCVGIESPGLSAGMGIAKYICALPLVYRTLDHIEEKNIPHELS